MHAWAAFGRAAMRECHSVNFLGLGLTAYLFCLYHLIIMRRQNTQNQPHR